MKTIKKINKSAIIVLLPLLLLLFVVSCGDDDTVSGGNNDITQLNAKVAEAENLIDTAVEGINAGDYQPGTKDILQTVINWVNKNKSTFTQAKVDDAILKLNAAIDTFLASTVSPAFPWVRQELGSGIDISENLKEVINGPSTMEFKVYIVDLNQAGFSNNLIAMVESPANGFGVRYFGDGQVEIYAGTTTAWPEAEAPAGTMKSGEWIDIAVTNTGDRQELYINGELVAAHDVTYSLPTTAPLRIGNSPTWTDRVSNALYTEFKVWDSVLDQTAIQANIGATFDGTEAGLECYFPLGSNLGDSFDDLTGNYTATLVGSVDWVETPPVIVLDYSNLNSAIAEITAFKATITEGDQDGDYPVGTIAYIDELLANANDVLANETRQTALDDTAVSLGAAITLINDNLVADAMGVYVDADDPNAVGFRITPNYTPQGDYTYEFDLYLNTLLMPFNFGDIMGNGNIGFRVNGYTQTEFDADAEAAILNSGGGWNWTNVPSLGYIGPMYDALTLRKEQWYHIAIIHDDTARTTGIYINGELVSESTDISAPVVSGWAEIWLGNSFGAKMNGSIKDFRIWDAVRSVGQLNADITGSEAGLRMYFPLERVGGISVADETGNYSGELRGVVWNK